MNDKIKYIISGTIILLIVFTGLFLLADYLSYKKVTFNISSDTESINIYKEPTENPKNNKDLELITNLNANNSSTRLKPGNYSVEPIGEKVSNNHISITVKSSKNNFDIKPFLSKDYLAKSFNREVPKINQAIKAKFPKIIDEYKITTPGVFLHYGDFYVTRLEIKNPQPRTGIDTYGVILQKKDDKWTVIADPDIVFLYRDHKDIPKDVVNASNRFADYMAIE